MSKQSPDNESANPSSPARRRLLSAGVGALAAVPGAVFAGGAIAGEGAQSADSHVADAPKSVHTQDRVECLGPYQAGITTPRPSAGMVASFFVLAETLDDLERLFHVLTDRITFLTTGGSQPDLDPKLPPAGLEFWGLSCSRTA